MNSLSERRARKSTSSKDTIVKNKLLDMQRKYPNLYEKIKTAIVRHKFGKVDSETNLQNTKWDESTEKTYQQNKSFGKSASFSNILFKTWKSSESKHNSLVNYAKREGFHEFLSSIDDSTLNTLEKNVTNQIIDSYSQSMKRLKNGRTRFLKKQNRSKSHRVLENTLKPSKQLGKEVKKYRRVIKAIENQNYTRPTSIGRIIEKRKQTRTIGSYTGGPSVYIRRSKSERLRAAVKIQSFCRMMIARKNYIKMKAIKKIKEQILLKIASFAKHTMIGHSVKKKKTSLGNLLIEIAKTGNVHELHKIQDRIAKLHVNFLDSRGNSPLYYACIKGYYLVAAKLVRLGAKVNQKCQGNSTPLHEAFLLQKPDLAIFLLNHGADPTALNDDMNTPVDLASENMLNVLKINEKKSLSSKTLPRNPLFMNK